LERCTCRKDKDLCNRVVASEVTRTIKAIEQDSRILSVIRNGGWELWFRNLLLMHMEQADGFDSIGVTEAASRSRRADLVFHCIRCGGIMLAAEVKTNFSSQRRDVAKRIHDAQGQLEDYIKHPKPIPGYVIYTVTDLWHEQNAAYATRHNGAVQTRYKRFRNHTADVAREALADVGGPFSKHTELARCHLHIEGAHASICVWVARVFDETHPLAFLNRSGGITERKSRANRG